MTTDVPVQFLKLPKTEKSNNQAHSVPLVPIPARKPKIAEPQTTANKIVPVPARKPLPENATLEQQIQRYIAEQSPYLQPLLIIVILKFLKIYINLRLTTIYKRNILNTMMENRKTAHEETIDYNLLVSTKRA